MGDGSPDVHNARAERAERLADDGRRRSAGARAAAERHERLGSDPVASDRHRRAAAMHRDAQLIYEQAAALQIAHAAREPDAGEKLTTAHHRFTATAAPAAVTPTDLGNRYAVLARQEALADQRERAADARERTADDRGQIADAREHAADERHRIADARDRAADDRDAVATAWEDQIDARERRFDEAKPPYHRFAADQPSQRALVLAAIVRTRQRFATEVRALQR